MTDSRVWICQESAFLAVMFPRSYDMLSRTANTLFEEHTLHKYTVFHYTDITTRLFIHLCVHLPLNTLVLFPIEFFSPLTCYSFSQLMESSMLPCSCCMRKLTLQTTTVVCLLVAINRLVGHSIYNGKPG